MGSVTITATRFRVQDVASLLGTNPRRVEGWVEQGFLKPAARGRGPGRPHEFDLANLLQAALMLELQSFLGAKSRYPNLITSGARAAAEAMARLVEKGEWVSERVLLVAHRGGIGPSFMKYDSLPRLQGSIDQAMKAGLTITLVGITGVLTKVQEALREWRESEAGT